MLVADLPPVVRAGPPVNGRVVVEADRPLPVVHALTAWALDRGVDLPDLEVRRPSLEDVYLELTTRR